MSAAGIIFVIASAFLTSTVSGVFGMAGGLLLMGALALVLPVSAAFVAHGVIQIVANGGRAVLHRRYVRWRIVSVYAVASLAAGLVMTGLQFEPSRALLFLLLGLVPALVWLPKNKLHLDAGKPSHAFLSGFCVTGLNLVAGVAGPLLDVFFVRTSLTRHQIVATKAATQVFSHLAKVGVYGAAIVSAGQTGDFPVWVLAAAAPLSIAGTVLGGRILDRLSDQAFLRWTRWIVTAIGAAYLAQAAWLWTR